MSLHKYRKITYIILLCWAGFSLYKASTMLYERYEAEHSRPRNETPALFNPHRATFTCESEATKVPPIDFQADAWFREALALDDYDLWEEDRDYKKIVQLTRQAAERRHWKAMLNLASLYLEGRDPPNGVDEALALVEEAMRLGIPAGYDRMGTFYQRGIGVQGDLTRAYAFWQRAADMGNPQSMVFLGEKMSAGWNSPRDSFWANIPIATKMLECAFAQGYGNAADVLAEMQAWPRTPTGKPTGPQTAETKSKALRTLHDGVKLGCEKCATQLWGDFDHPHDPSEMKAPHTDKARAQRYYVLSDALESNPLLRFPNLDKVLPLPPAPLPPWNGDKKTLIDAAKGVVPPPAIPSPTESSQKTGRYFLDVAFEFHPTDEKTSLPAAPFAGYWRPTLASEQGSVRASLSDIPPARYESGEQFELPGLADLSNNAICVLAWEYVMTVQKDLHEVRPPSQSGLTREVARPEPHIRCAPHLPCPFTGAWQPWLPPHHKFQHAVNHAWRQAWLTKGEPFPDPWGDLLPAADRAQLSWHLMDSAAPNLA